MSSTGPYGRHGFSASGSAPNSGGYSGYPGASSGSYGASPPPGGAQGGYSYTAPSPSGGYGQSQSYASDPMAGSVSGGNGSRIFIIFTLLI